MLVNIRLNGSSNDCVLEESSCCTHTLRLSLLCRRQLRCVRRTGGTDGEEGKEEGQEDVSKLARLKRERDALAGIHAGECNRAQGLA